MSPIHDPRFSQAHTDARQADFADSRRIVRWEYGKALILLPVALGATLLLSLAGTRAPIQLAVLWLAIKLFAGFVVGFIALLIGERLFVGDVGPKGLAALRLAGALAGAQVAWLVVGGVPLYGIVASSFVYALLIVWLFEMDLVEAVLVAALTWLLVIAVMLVLIFYVQSTLQ